MSEESQRQAEPSTPGPDRPGVVVQTAPKRTSSLAVWALVLGVVGMCFFPFSIVGAVLGVMALIRMSKDPALGGQAFAIVSLALVAVSLVTTGILAALAIPAFVGYVRRSKTAEATANIQAIYSGLDARYREDGKVVVLPLTPARIPCAEKASWSPEDRARFAAVGFDPGGPTYYSYEVVEPPPDVDARVLIRAHGDLDCDGNPSLFELAVGVDEAGGTLFRSEGFFIENQIE